MNDDEHLAPLFELQEDNFVGSLFVFGVTRDFLGWAGYVPAEQGESFGRVGLSPPNRSQMTFTQRTLICRFIHSINLLQEIESVKKKIPKNYNP
jgi:hypothetical protein